jgi:hypothetical protein
METPKYITKTLTFFNGVFNETIQIRALRKSGPIRWVATDADGFEINLIKSDLIDAPRPFQEKIEKIKVVKLPFFYDVALWTKSGDLRTRRVKVMAESKEEADKLVYERWNYKAYDISY